MQRKRTTPLLVVAFLSALLAVPSMTRVIAADTTKSGPEQTVTSSGTAPGGSELAAYFV